MSVLRTNGPLVSCCCSFVHSVFIVPCRAGQFSDDGYQPCSSAPVGYYTDNGLTLTQCPFGQTTTTVGSNSIDACVNITVQTGKLSLKRLKL